MNDNTELKKALIKEFGTKIENDYDTLLKCISAVVCARTYAGNVGNIPLCVLNRALENIIENKLDKK
jgi:hypothetical protein